MKSKNYNCKASNCHFKADSPNELGGHYREKPDHRPAYLPKQKLAKAKQKRKLPTIAHFIASSPASISRENSIDHILEQPALLAKHVERKLGELRKLIDTKQLELDKLIEVVEKLNVMRESLGLQTRETTAQREQHKTKAA